MNSAISTTMDSKFISPKSNLDILSTKKNPIDSFNQDILQSKEWGRSFGMGVSSSLPQLPNHKGMSVKKILGPIPKLPRERFLHPIPTKHQPSPRVSYNS